MITPYANGTGNEERDSFKPDDDDNTIHDLLRAIPAPIPNLLAYCDNPELHSLLDAYDEDLLIRIDYVMGVIEEAGVMVYKAIPDFSFNTLGSILENARDLA